MSTTSSTSPAPASPPITSTAHIHAHQHHHLNHHPPLPSSSSLHVDDGEDEDHPRLSPSSSPPQHHIHPTLPSPETERDISSARSAIVASISNLVDTELQSRATMLHENAGALDKQERSVIAATAGLRRERERLAREADVAARKIKELGNVQNWAEVLERQFLVLEETVRLANGGSDADSNCSCSCSECGGPTNDCGVARAGNGGLGRVQGDDHGDSGTAASSLRRKSGSKGDDADGSAKEPSLSVANLSLSDGSRSLNEQESGTGSSSTKSPETASTTTSI